MSSQLNVDTIVDKAGSGGSNVKMANTSTYVSDGGAVTQNTVQGLIKCFMDLNGTGTIALHDSFNISSVADGGTGIYTASINNDFASVNYGWAGSGENANDGQNGRSVTAISLGALAGSTEFYCSGQSNNTAEDLTHIRVGWWGDLA